MWVTHVVRKHQISNDHYKNTELFSTIIGDIKIDTNKIRYTLIGLYI